MLLLPSNWLAGSLQQMQGKLIENKRYAALLPRNADVLPPIRTCRLRPRRNRSTSDKHQVGRLKSELLGRKCAEIIFQTKKKSLIFEKFSLGLRYVVEGMNRILAVKE